MKVIKNISSLLILGLLCCNINLFAQTASLDSIYYKSDFQISERLVVKKDTIKSQLWTTYNVDKPYWRDGEKIPVGKYVNQNNKHLFMVTDKNYGPGGAIITNYNNGLIGFHPLRKSIELKDYKYSDLPFAIYMSADFKDNLKDLKSMADLTKSDLKKATEFVHSYESSFKGYMEAENLKSAFLFRIAETLYHLKLYQLGYNPYLLPMEGNYMDKFKNDEELKALFKEEQIFQLRID